MVTKEQMTKAAENAGLNEYDFVPEIIDDLADECNDGYAEPKVWFNDLFEHGCQSGMVGKFIYNADCKDCYIAHIDSMEDFKEELEDELGEPIKNRNGLRHYTFMCWLIYEETARRIASELWPDEF